MARALSGHEEHIAARFWEEVAITDARRRGEDPARWQQRLWDEYAWAFLDISDLWVPERFAYADPDFAPFADALQRGLGWAEGGRMAREVLRAPRRVIDALERGVQFADRRAADFHGDMVRGVYALMAQVVRDRDGTIFLTLPVEEIRAWRAVR